MLYKTLSAAVYGIEANLVEVEVDVGSSKPGEFTVVGLPDLAVKESRERIRSAVKNCGFELHHLIGNMRVGGPAFTSLSVRPSMSREASPYLKARKRGRPCAASFHTGSPLPLLYMRRVSRDSFRQQ